MSASSVREKDEISVTKQETVDITSLVQQTAESLSISDPMLCNRDSFNLQDSMAALELMDRKMDCCEVPATQVAPYGVVASEDKRVFPRPAPTCLNDAIEPLPWDDLTIQDAAYISLETLVLVETLLSGASVVESTFTCLYAHRPVLLDMKARLQSNKPSEEATTGAERTVNVAQHVVYGSVLMLLELTDVLRSIILNADIYEEEDFSVSTYNIPIFDDRDEATATKAASDALQMLAALESQNNHEVRLIRTILSFEWDFLTMCTSMARLAGKTVQKVVNKCQEFAATSVKKLNEVMILTKILKQNEPDRAKALIRKTFDSYVNRPLVGNAPVRKIVFHDVVESIGLLTTVSKELDWAVCGLLSNGNTMGRIRRILSRISTSSTNILTRSLIVLNLYFDDKILGQYSLTEMIVKHMQQMFHVPAPVFNNVCAQAFLNRLAKPIYDTLKVLILNRNRQRAYIEAVMLHDWASLQQEAHVVDLTYRKENGLSVNAPPHFSLYILYTTVELMDHFVNLGIELKLFNGHHELTVAYWYRDFLLSSLLSQVSSMRRAKAAAKAADQQQMESSARPQKGKKKGGKNHGKKGSNGSAAHEAPPTPEALEDEFEFLLLGLKRGLCRGLVRFMAALNQAGLVRNKEFEFTSKERIFQKRFEAFAAIQQPPPLLFDDFLKGSDFSTVLQNDLLVSTSECFNVSKSMVDKLLWQLQTINPALLSTSEVELRQLAKVCIGNSVYVQKLRQSVDKSGKAAGDVAFDLDTHNQFCTVKIN